MIWQQNEYTKQLNKKVWDLGACPYCSSGLSKLSYIHNQPEAVEVCNICGWWKVLKVNRTFHKARFGQRSENEARGTYSVLKNLDLSDVNQPIEEVQRFLAAKYDKRFNVGPKLFEKTVASVFDNVGYDCVVTPYSKDGGIDAVLTGPTGDTIGIQVKRSKNKITVSQIREFVGALIQGGYTEGVFVTTSSFTKDANSAASEFYDLGHPIELIDAPKFYDALSLKLTPMYGSYDEWKYNVGTLEYDLIERQCFDYEP